MRRSVGIDLSAEPRGTAVVTVEWSGDSAHIVCIVPKANDEAILAAILSAPEPSKVAIDSPLGWPDPLVDFLVAHRIGSVTVPVGLSGLAWRGRLSRRATDRWVMGQIAGVVPLAVGADRIAAVAMRAAGLLAALDSLGAPVQRDGSGVVLEVYPAAALRKWGLSPVVYKGAANRAALCLLVDQLAEALPGLDWNGYDSLCRNSDDAFDAAVCALLARAADLGLTLPPPDSDFAAKASTEGWIHLPRGDLAALMGGPRVT